VLMVHIMWFPGFGLAELSGAGARLFLELSALPEMSGDALFPTPFGSISLI
jgi:hypothetical protein